MSKMIKLSKSDWLRIGKEFGFFRQASPEVPPRVLLRGEEAKRRLSEMGGRGESSGGSGLGEVPRRASDFSDQMLREMLRGPGGSGRGEGPDDEWTDEQLEAMAELRRREDQEAFLRAEAARRARARARRLAREKKRQEAFNVEPKLQEDGS